MEKVSEVLLQAQGICAAYGSRQILCGVDLQISYGQTLAIMGKSGCGKTTLLNILGGLQRANAGALYLRGKQIQPAHLRTYRRDEVGFLFQNSALIAEMTALENVRVAASIAKSGADPLAYLRLVGLEDAANRFPHELSGGQAHRVALARALAKHPSLLLLDEPTEGQDKHTGQEMIDLTRKLCAEQGVAAVIVTHRTEHAVQMDRQFVLRDGVLVEGAVL